VTEGQFRERKGRPSGGKCSQKDGLEKKRRGGGPIGGGTGVVVLYISNDPTKERFSELVERGGGEGTAKIGVIG